MIIGIIIIFIGILVAIPALVYDKKELSNIILRAPDPPPDGKEETLEAYTIRKMMERQYVISPLYIFAKHARLFSLLVGFIIVLIGLTILFIF